MLTYETQKTPHIYVFGAGGTGGFTIEYLTRLFAGTDAFIEVYDGDTVEAKNLKRQNFTISELGMYKAQALVDRLEGMTLDAPVLTAHNEYVSDEEDILEEVLINQGDNESVIFIITVDNVETRRTIDKAITLLGEAGVDVISFDGGNSDQGGQVVLSGNITFTYTPFGGQAETVALQSMLTLFPELDTIDSDADRNPAFLRNCAEAVEGHPQAMMANVRNAEIIASNVYVLSQNKPFADNIWISDLHTGTTRSELRL